MNPFVKLIKLLPFFGIVVVFAGPFVAAYYLLSTEFEPQATTNHGELITPPIDFARIELIPSQGKAFQVSEINGKWLILFTSGPRCEEACRQWLLYSRQVHKALGKEASRVMRVMLLPENHSLDKEAFHFIQQENFYMKIAEAELTQLAESKLSPDTLYLVDPNKNIMMKFKLDTHTGSDVLKDLKKLLKLSKIG